MFKARTKYIGIQRQLLGRLDSKALKCILTPLARVFDKLLSFAKSNKILSKLGESAPFEQLCVYYKQNLQYQFEGDALFVEQIPEAGPCVIIANHPTGFLETLALPELIYRKRKDLKVLAQSFCDDLPFADEALISVDIYNQTNHRRVFKESGQWLKQGGVLLVFPAGEISNYHWQDRQTKDKAWSHFPVWLAKRYQSPIVHVYLQAKNSWLFYLVSVLCKSARVLLICHELYNKKNKTFKLFSSSAVMPNILGDTDEPQVANYLYHLNAILKHRAIYQDAIHSSFQPLDYPALTLTYPDKMRHEVESLAEDNVIYRLSSFLVYDVSADQIPALLDHIQVAREVTFRDVGMGTGADKDGDEHDKLCRHLFIWDKKQHALVGSYRYLLVNAVHRESYIADLYNIDYSRIEQGGTMMECSRSFIVKAYQKSFKPLLCLWRGLAQVVLSNDSIRYLSGLVSIPGGTLESKVLDIVLLYTMKMSRQLPAIEACFQPKNPYTLHSELCDDIRQWVLQCDNVVQLENGLSQLSGRPFSLPVLFKQYESIGLLPLNMSVDPDFSNCIDVLQVWDIAYHIPEKLKIFFGKEGMEQLHHRQQRIRNQQTLIDNGSLGADSDVVFAN